MVAKVKEKSTKYIYLEIMRIIAIFFVIFNHTGQNGFLLFSQQELGGFNFFLYLFISIFCKFSVPIFFAISGALMLKKENESLLDLWKKRIFRMILVLFFISFIYYMVSIGMSFNKFDILLFLKKCYTATIKDHLWFLYTYIAYLIGLPFLRNLVKNLENKHYYYMIAIAIFFSGLLPIIEYLLFKGNYHITSYIKITWLTTNIVLYPCIGYFLRFKFKCSNKKTILFIWFINLLCIMLSCFMTYYKIKITSNLSSSQIQDFFPNFIAVNCICIFITIKYLFEKINISKFVEKMILSFGSCTFGIYLIHVLIKDTEMMKSLLNLIKNIGVNYMLAVILWCLCIMIISYLIVFILKKIPILKRLL